MHSTNTPASPSNDASATPLAFKYGNLSAFKEAYQRRWDYKGRTTREAFWWSMTFLLMMPFLLLPLAYISMIIFAMGMPITAIISSLACAILFYHIIIINTSLYVRRFHDIGLSGWYCGICYISIILFVLYLIINTISLYLRIDFTLPIYRLPEQTNSLIILVSSIIINMMTITMIILTLFDSKRGSNKWGSSQDYRKAD